MADRTPRGAVVIERAISVRVEPLSGGYVRAFVADAPELDAIARSATRALVRLGRVLDGGEGRQICRPSDDARSGRTSRRTTRRARRITAELLGAPAPEAHA